MRRPCSRRGKVAVALCLTLALAAPCHSEEAPALRIGTTTAPPFAMQGADGAWIGLSIDLLSQVADRVGFRYELVEAEPGALVGEVAAGRLDGAIGAIVPTADGERAVDFTNGYFQSGLAVAVPSTRPVPILDLLKALASPEFRSVLAVLILLTVVIGALAWVAERRKNPEFEQTAARGLFSGFWWATVTMTTVGYGDKAPITVAGRLLGIVWMLLALGLVSLATAQLSAILTADRLNGGVSTAGDLTRMRVGIVAGGPATAQLKALGTRVETFPTLGDGLRAVTSGEIDAFVADESELAWESAATGGIDLAPVRFAPETYAMALPEGSSLREPINRAILDTLGSAAWFGTLRYYLGPE
ncbi:ABC-type amino acid transport substrate-binding protein [Amaricoccus macauensis]|uniref:ABC-type amino acid transport substrate-binding protein n=1 Tax=Amaricoccus macauensis TaxID=57001 RepID=A0A840SQG4_9RHOB|nr:transporter substrate-binding domain-containing protein [Amaricoccus macauensis]MBB5221492.1 ABC-type amino acid transport substrate-binding protein [Amaricoccus macauensis]